MGFREPQTPGLGGLTELTSSELSGVQNLFTTLSLVQGDILYHDGTKLNRLAAGTSGWFLKTQGAGANPIWATVAGSGTVTSVSVVTANGVSGTVATATSTPAITLTLGAIVPNTVVASDATTPHVDTVAGSTNTGYFLVNGKTSGSLKITAADATVQAITLTVAAQTVGAATLTIPNMANVNKTVAWLESPAFTTPNIGVATATSVNKITLTAPATGSTLTLIDGKTLTINKTMSFTAADDTGVYTLPTGTKTLLATDGAGTALTGIPYTLTGTANQVVLSAGTGNITFSLPQSIGTASNPQFATIELGHATDTTISRSAAGAIQVEGVQVILSGAALGTPASGTLTNCTSLPIAGLTASTSTAIGVGSIELGHATDTTITRSAAGAIQVEGVQVILSGAALGTPASGTLTNCTSLPIAGLTASTSTAIGVGSVELGHATDTTLTRSAAGVLAVEGVVVPSISSTNTITNKRNQPRITSATSYTTDTGTSLDVSTTDIFVITAQAGALKFNNPSGTPVQGEKLLVRIKDNATARALTYDTQFRASSDLALPATTVLSKTLYMLFIYNSTDTKWDLLSVLNNI